MVTGGPASTVGPPGVRGWLARRRDERELFVLGLEWRDRWRWVAEGTAVARTSPCVAGGLTVSTPEVVAVDLGPPVRLTVRLLAGQVPDDVAAVGARLAEGLSVASIRAQRHRLHGYVVVTLLPVDPLAVPVQRGRRDVEHVAVTVQLGDGEDGRPVALDVAAAAHVVVQGATRSGKSTGLYSVLGQLAEHPHVIVSGCDPTGLLLGPWSARSGPFSPSLGTGVPAAPVAVLEALTGEMDQRVRSIPPGRDSVEIGPWCPLLVVVLEEWPALLRVLDTHDRKLGQLARAAVARLLSEGAKSGVRVVLVTQRADAHTIGAFERGQASHTISFRVDNADAVKMLHSGVPVPMVAQHATAPAGVALLSSPGQALTRLRFPHVSYGEYVALVGGGVR